MPISDVEAKREEIFQAGCKAGKRLAMKEFIEWFERHGLFQEEPDVTYWIVDDTTWQKFKEVKE